jgi:hypothetical protein
MAQMKTGFERCVNAFVFSTADYADFSDWGAVAAATWFRCSAEGVTLNSPPTRHRSLVTSLELAFVLCGIEMAFRFSD